MPSHTPEERKKNTHGPVKMKQSKGMKTVSMDSIGMKSSSKGATEEKTVFRGR